MPKNSEMVTQMPRLVHDLDTHLWEGSFRHLVEFQSPAILLSTIVIMEGQ